MTSRVRWKTRPASALAALTLAGLALAPAGAGAQAISGNVVRIGILNDQSGVYAEFGGRGSVEAARMAVEDFGGSVAGAPVEIVNADHQNKPDVASSIARQWYDRDGVDAILELTTSSVALAVQGLSKEKGKIDIVTGAATSDLTGKACAPYGFHWAYDTRSLAVGTGGALVQQGGDTWFFLTADYAFGYSLEAETSQYVTSKGGKVLGAVRHPLSAQDFSSFLLQAQGSKAKIIGLANAGLDTANAIKQASEFGIVQGGQRLAGLLFTLAEVHGLGLQAAQGLVLTEGWYWDLDDANRAFAKRFMARTGKMPNMIHAGTYSAVLQYLKAVKAAGTDETAAVAKKLHEMPVDDVFAKGGKVLANGRMIHDMHLFQVKAPGESRRRGTTTHTSPRSRASRPSPSSKRAAARPQRAEIRRTPSPGQGEGGPAQQGREREPGCRRSLSLPTPLTSWPGLSRPSRCEDPPRPADRDHRDEPGDDGTGAEQANSLLHPRSLTRPASAGHSLPGRERGVHHAAAVAVAGAGKP